jgi:hypothetical protein
MNLTLGVIIDGFSGYKPIVHKINDKKAQIRGFHYYSAEFTETDPEYLYVINIDKIGRNFCDNCPKHIIISGNIPEGLVEKAHTLIQIQKNIPVETIIQTGNELFAYYDVWYNSLLMAVINHKSMSDFLNIASKMLVNPLLVMNNNFGIIGTGGTILSSIKGTIWERVNVPGFVLEDFYTPEEIRKISLHVAQKSEQIIEFNPANDPAHFTLGINIWIDDKLYGAIGSVDMNKPFTEGQKETFVIIAKVLKMYFQNHSIYMRIAEDKTNWLDSLLNGVDISEDIIFNYLYKYQWKIDDNYCIVTFTTPEDLKIPIISILDIKQINELFPEALVSVFDESIVMIIRCVDKQRLNEKKKQQLEQFLKKDIVLRCGVSMVFNNFLHLRYYYIQSKFAASQCKPTLDSAICFYEEYQADHVLNALSQGADLRCFCHPGILSLWESGNESQRDLVQCLYYYFLNGRNLSSAAEAINIHRNTLIYRLTKAEEILNIDIKNISAKQAFLFIISCMIVQGL